MDSDDANPVPFNDEYEAEWASIVDDAVADPREGVVALLDILERMLGDDAGAAVGEVDREGVVPEIAAPLAAARDLIDRMDAGDDVDDAEAADAVAGLVEFWDEVSVGSTRYAAGAGSIDPAAADQLEVEQAADDENEE
jgi:hypothetical protein